jgi:acyl-CoA thioester hydrolase
MFSFVYRHRVRYRECDPMGVVYHTHFLDFFEAARTEALREMGLAYRALEDSGVVMPVVDVALKYLRPAHYDDLLEITCRFDQVPVSRVTITYEVRRCGDAEILVTGHVTLCFVDRVRNRPIAAPERVRSLFQDALAESHAG